MTIRRTVIAAAVIVALAGGIVYWFGFSRPEKFVHKDLVSARVTAIPSLEDASSDGGWGEAQPLRGDNLTLRSVHDDRQVALLFEWDDPTLSMGTSGAWRLTDAGWRQNRAAGKWESFAGKRHPEWLGLYWNIDSPSFARQGCTATCHEGTGKHHMVSPGEHVDTWHVLAKHGWGPKFIEDQGWLLGGESIEQAGEVRFADEQMDPRQPVSGTFTFAGNAEDGVLSKLSDEPDGSEKTPAVEYCTSCHDRPDAVMGDAGAIPYVRNSAAQGSTPHYIETSPKDFADAMVLTSSEVESGEAKEVSKLGGDALRAAWGEYERVNATVPELVLSEPSGSAGDLEVTARWRDGRWTVRVVRDLVTGSSDDVQFSDTAKKYGFAVSLWDKSDLAGDIRMYPLLLRFAD